MKRQLDLHGNVVASFCPTTMSASLRLDSADELSLPVDAKPEARSGSDLPYVDLLELHSLESSVVEERKARPQEDRHDVEAKLVDQPRL